MKILVTSFEPFNHESINPSFEIMKRLEDRIADAEIIKTCVPVVFDKAIEHVSLIIDKEKPDCVLSIGQAGGRNSISIEKVALNYKNTIIPDNENNYPQDQKIAEDGSLAYPSLLPCEEIAGAINEANIPASLSYSAGTFVCNDLMYGILYLIDKKYPNMISGFIHVPFCLEQCLNKDVFRMDIDEMVKAIKIAINIIIKNKK